MLSKEVFIDQNALIDGVMNSLLQLVAQTLGTKESFHLALTGGDVGGKISARLALKINEDSESYKGLHIWWSDERFLPRESAERNCYPFLAVLETETYVHVHEVFAAESNLEVQAAASRYNVDSFGIAMDLTLLSVGVDGHVASLFPQLWNSICVDGVIPILNSPKPPSQRISFSLAKINASERVWLFASGIHKREIISRMVIQDKSIPASFVHGKSETRLFTDLQSD